MTVGGELNKLASNVGMGRAFSGNPLAPGRPARNAPGRAGRDQPAKDQAHLYNENYTGFTFTGFNGNTITV